MSNEKRGVFNMKHTPLPWIVANGPQVWRNGHNTVESPRICTAQNAAKPVNQLPPEELQANAEFIVRACNSHYELLACVKRLAEFIENGEQPNNGFFECREAWRKAIANATKK
jgi:hypothetical protein